MKIAMALCSMLGTAFTTSQYKFEYSSKMIPHPQKAEKGGEDAFYESEDLLVVADGVGGWNQVGIDPSAYSRGIVNQTQFAYRGNEESYAGKLRSLLWEAFRKNTPQGSSTYVGAMLVQDQLQICNVGDSGLLLIRTSYEQPTLVLVTSEQQHRFNMPFQLQYKGRDTPDIAVCMKIQVEQGDIVVVASDGIIDNVWSSQILHQVKQGLNTGTLFTSTPNILASLAISRGDDKEVYTPFAMRASQYGLTYNGGKLDDSTVIIAKIVSKNINSHEQQKKAAGINMDDTF